MVASAKASKKQQGPGDSKVESKVYLDESDFHAKEKKDGVKKATDWVKGEMIHREIKNIKEFLGRQDSRPDSARLLINKMKEAFFAPVSGNAGVDNHAPFGGGRSSGTQGVDLARDSGPGPSRTSRTLFQSLFPDTSESSKGERLPSRRVTPGGDHDSVVQADSGDLEGSGSFVRYLSEFLQKQAACWEHRDVDESSSHGKTLPAGESMSSIHKKEPVDYANGLMLPMNPSADAAAEDVLHDGIFRPGGTQIQLPQGLPDMAEQFVVKTFLRNLENEARTEQMERFRLALGDTSQDSRMCQEILRLLELSDTPLVRQLLQARLYYENR